VALVMILPACAWLRPTHHGDFTVRERCSPINIPRRRRYA